MTGFRIFSATALIWWTFFLVSSVSSSDSFEDIIQDSIDYMVQDLTNKYSSDFDSNTFWHPYVYGTGNENREIVHVDEVKIEYIEGDCFQWKYARLGLKHYVVCLSTYSIDLFGSDFKKITSVDSSDALEALAVYTRWNEEHYYPELIILAVTSEPRLNVYLLNNDVIENVGTFPLHYAVKGIELCQVGSSTKVVIIPKENVDIDIYNVEVSNSSQVWFFQRLPEVGSPNVVVFDSDMIESVIAVAKDTEVEFYTFDSQAKLFHIYQSVTIPSPCRGLFAFTLAYQHYVGCIPEEKNSSVLFIAYNYNTNEYVIEDGTFGNITAVAIYPVAVADYRDEYFLIVQDRDGLTHIMSYHGRQIGFQVEKTCNQDGLGDCPSIADLSRGIGFRQNDYTVYVFPSGQGSQRSEVWLINKKILDTLSPLVVESRNLYSNFHDLSKRYEEWERGVYGVQKKLKKRIQLDQPNIITGSWDVESVSASQVQFNDSYEEKYVRNDTEDVFDSLTFMDAPWTDKDFSTDPLQTIEGLSTLQKNVGFAKIQLGDAVYDNSEYVQMVTAPQNVSGTFNSKYLSTGSLLVTTIQNYRNATKYFNSLATNSAGLHIRSHVVFETPLRVSNLITEVMNEVVVSDIARLSEENIFNCSLQFITAFMVHGNVSATTVNGVNIGTELVTPSNIADFEFVDGFIIKNNTNNSGPYGFHKVLIRSGEQMVNSHVNFATLKATSPITIDLINGYSLSEFALSVISEDYSGEIHGTKTVSEAVDAGSLNITTFWNYLPFPNFFVHKTQKRVVISDKKNFTYITAEKVTVGKHLDSLDPNSFVELSSSMDINSKWTFVEHVTIINDIWVSGTVDDVYMEELKNKGTLDQYIESYIANADVEFEQEIQVDNLLVKSKINGNEFDDAFGNLLLFNGSRCKIPGLTTVDSNLILDSLNIDTGAINSYDLKFFFTVGDDQNMTGNIKLMSECQFQSLFALERYDTVDLRGLLLHAVHLTATNKIPWKIHFDHIKCGASMVVDDPINDILYYGSSIGVISGREFQTFLSDLSFENAVFQNLEVDNVYLPEGTELDGMDIPSWNYSRLSLSKDERCMFRFEIEGLVKASDDIYTKTINDVRFLFLWDSTLRSDRKSQTFLESVSTQSYVKISGLTVFEDEISGYSLEDLKSFAFPLNSNEDGWLQLTGSWHFQSIKVLYNVDVKGTTCGVDLEALNSDSVRKDESNVQIFGENTFTSMTVTQSIRADFLNNVMNFDKIFTVRGTQSIDCPFHFLKDVTVDGSLITNGQLNNISIASLASAYSQEDENVHIVHGDYLSDHVIKMESVKVAGLIQGIKFQQQISNFLKTSDPYLQFKDMKVFKNPVIINDDAVITIYNDIRTADLSIQKLNDDIIFNSEVTYKGPVETGIVESYVDNVDPRIIVRFDWEKLISHSIPINGKSTYENLKNLNLENVFVKGFLNVKTFQNQPFSEYVTLNGEQTLEWLRIHQAKFFGSNIPVNGLVSGVDLLEKFKDTLMTNYNSVYNVEGKKLFKGSVIVNGNFNCFGPTLKEEVVDISKDFNISSPIQFVKPLYVDGGVNVTEPVHGHTIDSIVSEALTQEDDQSITGEWKFPGGVTFKEDIQGTGKLQNYDLQGLIDRKNVEIKAAEERINKQKQRFQESCYNVYNYTEELTSNAMKLDAFDKHQSIILRKQVDKVITIEAAGKLYLLTSSSTCEITKYEWKPSTELFYKEFDVEQIPTRFGHVRDWQSVTHGNIGILVFSNHADTCSSLQTGIHVLLLEPPRGFSATSTLLLGETKAFKLVSDVEGFITAVFVLKEDNCLQILIWDEMEKRFLQENEIILKESYNRIELTSFRGGVGVLLCSENEVSIYHYSWTIKSMVLMGSDYFLTDKGSSISLFESYDDLYAIVPQKMTPLSTLKSSCTVQIFKASNQEMHRLQQLPLQDLKSQSVISFSDQIYVIFLSKSFGPSIYKFMGLNGLQRLNKNPVKVFNGVQVHNFDVKPWHFSASRPFFLLLTSKTIEVFHSNVYGDSLTSSSRNLCRVSY